LTFSHCIYFLDCRFKTSLTKFFRLHASPDSNAIRRFTSYLILIAADEIIQPVEEFKPVISISPTFSIAMSAFLALRAVH
jgi:hypothetical protein